MPAYWSLRSKLILGLGLFSVVFLALFGSAIYGLYAYRGLVKSLSARAAELPLASNIQQHVNDLRLVLSQATERAELPGMIQSVTDSGKQQVLPWDAQMLRSEYLMRLGNLSEAIERYRRQLDQNNLDRDLQLGDDSHERQTLEKIDAVMARLSGAGVGAELGEDWVLRPNEIEKLRTHVDKLRTLGTELPSYLQTRLLALSDDVKAQYRTALIIAFVDVAVAGVLVVVSVRGSMRWFARPLQLLVDGSRAVARGDFDYRIQLDTSDEMGELADSMNAMTERFLEVRDGLDQQVRERTEQVLRSEKLASVGFLAAGVAHEINNPLASIALGSESLDSRIQELVENKHTPDEEEAGVIRHYLQMIQHEAFRCKQITEKLLDFARMGDSQRVRTDLRDLVEGVVDMVQHLGKHRDKLLQFAPGSPVYLEVNPQEMKQVVLNLIANGLESLDAQGTVRVEVKRTPQGAQIVVEDNGCGMSEEVKKHLFEPFFTRRRGGQGTGLGLSITYRIVAEHSGTIHATSEGPGLGSRFVVSLPDELATKEKHHQYQAA